MMSDSCDFCQYSDKDEDGQQLLSPAEVRKSSNMCVQGSVGLDERQNFLRAKVTGDSYKWGVMPAVMIDTHPLSSMNIY